VETLIEAKNKIHVEITTMDTDVFASYFQRYSSEVEQFEDLMAQTTIAWHALANKVEKQGRVAFVANISYCAIMLHIQSMKLFLSGHIVAAGNLSRQVVESIAMALLCSGNTLTFMDRFINDKYSTKNAVKDVIRHKETLGLREGGVVTLKEAVEFYNKFSHLSKLTIAAATPFSEHGLYVGASFDQAKIQGYDTEVRNRLSLAKVFPNFVTALLMNVDKW